MEALFILCIILAVYHLQGNFVFWMRRKWHCAWNGCARSVHSFCSPLDFSEFHRYFALGMCVGGCLWVFVTNAIFPLVANSVSEHDKLIRRNMNSRRKRFLCGRENRWPPNMDIFVETWFLGQEKLLNQIGGNLFEDNAVLIPPNSLTIQFPCRRTCNVFLAFSRSRMKGILKIRRCQSTW